METTSLILASFLLTIPIFISYREHLQLEKELIWSVIRAIVQLTIMGYILNIIFGLQSPIFTFLIVLIMIINAAYNTKKRGEGINRVVLISFVALISGTSVTLTGLIVSQAIEFVPNEIIPIAGMIVSNAMVAVCLSYRHLKTSFETRRQEVEVKLSLGATELQSSKEIIRESIKIALIPSIDSAKTLGIVSLPGMMTGLIIAGESPLVAVKFQIMVTFMLLAATSCSVIIATYLSYTSFFNERKQLNI